MVAFDVAKAFFHACESLKGWEGCAEFVADGATFDAQCEPLTEVTSVESYCEWMAGLGGGPLQGCHYDLHSCCWDEDNKTALFFATFHGKHAGEGGPVFATGMSTQSHYVYAITMNDDNKVQSMIKIWNAPWALTELGWT